MKYLLFCSFQELSYWFYQLSVLSDIQKTSVLAHNLLYVTCVQQRDKILTINVFHPCLFYMKLIYNLLLVHKSLCHEINERDFSCGVNNFLNDQQTDLGRRMWIAKQVNQKLGKSFQKVF